VLRRVLAFALVFVLAFNLICVSAAETEPQLFCPNCKTYNSQGLVNAHNYCKKCGCSLRPFVFGGGPSRGGGAGRTDVPKKYYTQGTGSGDQYKVSSGTTNYYSIVNTTNKTLNYTTYNKTTNNYTYNSYTYNNYTYNNEYNYYTYNINNQYYYVTNNYTYVTISYPDGTKNDEGKENYDNVDVHYQLPDGRNSSYLTVDQVWGEYFIYNGTNYQSIMEDDGNTVGLFHLDGDTVDSSYHPGVIARIEPSSYSFGDAVFNGGLFFTTTGASHREASLYLSPSDICYTIEYWVFYSSRSYRHYNGDPYTTPFLYPLCLGGQVRLSTDTWHHIRLTFNPSSDFGSDNYTWVFVDGYKMWEGVTALDTISNSCYLPGNVDTVPNTEFVVRAEAFGVDEIRFCRNILSSGFGVENGSYVFTPQSQPYDSNLVFVAPSNPADNDVAIMSSIPVSTFRVGGVRPTYPTLGATYVAIESGIVKSVQQYDGSGWNSVNASIYTGGAWIDFIEYDLVNFGNDENSAPPDSSGSGGSGGSGEDGNSIWDKVAQGLSDFLGVVGDLIGGLLSGILQLLTSVLSSLTQAIPLITEFSGVIVQLYSFLPSEWQVLLTAAFSIFLILGVVRLFYKG